MKSACLTLVMIGCAVLVHRTSYAFSTNSGPQEQSSESSIKPRSSNHPMSASSADNRSHQKFGTYSDGQQTRRHISDKKHSHNRIDPIRGTRPKQGRNSRERSTSENVMNAHQPRPGKPDAGAAKIANRRNLPVRTAGVGALNGTQIKDSHNRRVAPAIIGRTANTTKGTAAIEGTSLNRRHAN